MTGDRELALVSADQEIAIGEQQYAPSQQMQGGEYALDPELTTYVAGVGQKLAAVSDRQLPYEFVVLNSSVPNAWALPGGKIAVNRGLLTELNSEAELAAVLGHEIVHAAARHGALAMQRGLLLQGALLATQVAAQRSDYGGLTVGAASLGAQLLTMRNSREAELESDLYGMRYMAAAGYDPSAAVTLQETFVRLSEQQRRRRRPSRDAVREPPAVGGARREEPRDAGDADSRRRSRPRTLSSRDRALAAATARRTKRTTKAAQRSPTTGPPTPSARRRRRCGCWPRKATSMRCSATSTCSSAATTMRCGTTATRSTATTSSSITTCRKASRIGNCGSGRNRAPSSRPACGSCRPPTRYYALGTLAEQRGDRQAALEHYERASSSNSPAGKAAQDATVRIDLPANPGKYIQARGGLDNAGQLIVEVANPTGVAVTDVLVAVRYADAQGAVREAGRRINELPAGQATRIATGLGPFTSAQQFEVGITDARVARSD